MKCKCGTCACSNDTGSRYNELCFACFALGHASRRSL